MWSVSYVTCVDKIAQVSLTQWSIYLISVLPTLKLRITIIFPINQPETILLPAHKTKYLVAFALNILSIIN